MMTVREAIQQAMDSFRSGMTFPEKVTAVANHLASLGMDDRVTFGDIRRQLVINGVY